MRVSWPDFCAASTALPAAPRAGFPPLIPTFSPTRFHEEPHFFGRIWGLSHCPPSARFERRAVLASAYITLETAERAPGGPEHGCDPLEGLDGSCEQDAFVMADRK